MVPYVIRRRRGRFLQIFFPFEKCLYLKKFSFSLRGRVWVGGGGSRVGRRIPGQYLSHWSGWFFFFFFCILMLMRDVGKLYSKRWKQKTLVVNWSLDSVSRLTLVALSLYTTTHSLPPSSPNVYYHFNQLSHCSPRLKTSEEEEEGNCWLSSECNLRFSCILCDAINSPSLPRSLSSLLFFSIFCNWDVDQEEKMKENGSKIRQK